MDESVWRALTLLLSRAPQAGNMKKAESHLEAQRTIMNSKGTKRKVKAAQNGQPAVFKWKKERLR